MEQHPCQGRSLRLYEDVYKRQVLDRSGSMAGSPLANMKTGAKTFIDIIDEETDSSQDGTIGSGSRIGIVSFADRCV